MGWNVSGQSANGGRPGQGKPAMTRRIMLRIFLGASLAAFAGCVERGLVITSDPPGATVTVNHQWTGTTPFVLPFKHYGVYDIWIEHPGYEENGRMVKFYPMHVGEPVKAPGYQYFGADFVSEVLLPATLYDQHNLHYILERVDRADEISDVLARATQLRTASQARTEMRRERDEAGRRGRSRTAADGGDSGRAIDDANVYQSDYDYYIDATPPDPTQVPVFGN